MPVGIPQFDPQGDSSDAARIALAYGPGNSSDPSLTSMMQRASQLRMQKEQHDLQMKQAELMQPVAEVKAKADLASAQSALASHVQMQKLREQAATAAPIANSEFIDASTLADWDQQSAALSQLQAKYSWMANVRDESGNQIYNGFLSAIDKARANAFMRGQIDARIEGVNEGVEKRGDIQKSIAGTRADSAEEVARTRAAAQKTEAERLRASLAEAEASGDTEGANFYRGILQKKSTSAAPKKLEIERLRELRAAAEDAGDMQGAQEYSDRIKKINAITPGFGDMINAVRGSGASAAAEQKPAPTTEPRPAKPVAAEGPKKSYAVEDGQVMFDPSLPPDELLRVVNQAVKDKAIDPDPARALLLKLGFIPKTAK